MLKDESTQEGFLLSVAQAHEIGMAMRRLKNGPWTPQLVHLLTKGDMLGKFRLVLLDRASIHPVENIVIDCSADPFVPFGWAIQEHRAGGVLKWDLSRVELYVAPGQKNGGCMDSRRLRRHLSRKPTLNACVLDFLLKHPRHIPESWKEEKVGFWGTTYRNRDDVLCVRFLCYEGNSRWGEQEEWIDEHSGFRGDYSAALRASK